MLVTVKRKTGNSWAETQEPIENLQRYEGTDTVAIIGEGMIWVGNKKWEAKYLEDKRFHLVTNTANLPQSIKYAMEIFFENREHGLAQRTQDGDVTDTEAHAQMDKEPNKYATQQELI